MFHRRPPSQPSVDVDKEYAVAGRRRHVALRLGAWHHDRKRQAFEANVPRDAPSAARRSGSSGPAPWGAKGPGGDSKRGARSAHL